MAAVAVAAGGAGLVSGRQVRADDVRSHFSNGITVEGALGNFFAGVWVKAGGVVGEPGLTARTLGAGGVRGLTVEQYTADDAAPLIRVRKARSFNSTMLDAVKANDSLMSLRVQGATGYRFDLRDGAVILASAAEDWDTFKNGTRMQFYTTPVGTAAPTERMRFDAVGNVAVTGNLIVNLGTLPTTATRGFPFIPAMAGPPTGIPDRVTGHGPLVLDTVNNRLWAYVNDAWRGTSLTL